MVFTKKPRYISLDIQDEEAKTGAGTSVPALKVVTIETGFRWILTVIALLCISIFSAWITIYQNWGMGSFSATANPIMVSCQSPPVTPVTPVTPVSSCVSPPIRREWRTLSTAAKKNYINAVQCLSTKPSQIGGNGSLYDDFPWIHQQTAPTAHAAASFFPWHRYFIHVYEKALKNECGYQGTLPYWDWSADWKDFANSPVWDSEKGFGGDGSSWGDTTVGEGRCVTDGPFADFEAKFYGENYEPHCLSRGFSTDSQLDDLTALIRPDVVESIMDTDDFDKFSSALEKNAHHFISHSIRGDFAKYTGPYDPVFFLHHSNLDRLWWQWQQEKPKDRLFAYSGPSPKTASSLSVDLSDILDVGGLDSTLAVNQVMQTNNAVFCYQY